MNKVILICGKIASGKTTYAKSLIKENPAVLLSQDEITSIFFGQYDADKQYIVVDKTREFIFKKSLEIIKAGSNVIIDWGFWTRAERKEAVFFYEKNNITFEWHYIDTSNDVCLKNLIKRNHEIKTGQLKSMYYLPEEVAERFWGEMFEIPEKDEMDIWYENKIV